MFINLVSRTVAICATFFFCTTFTYAGNIFKCADARGRPLFSDVSLGCKANSIVNTSTPVKKTTTTATTSVSSVSNTASATKSSSSTPSPNSNPSPSPSSTPSPTLTPTTPTVETNYFGTHQKPFAVNSPWNSRPLNYTLGNDVIPTDSYEAVIAPGDFSTSFFVASSSDLPVTIYGVYDQDSETTKDLVLPHWPVGITSAAGTDGHIDVLDSTTGILHSFWIARLNSGKWTAKLYAWSKIDGSGFGDPAHYYQGARAAAVPTSAGIIRKHEIDDGKDQYYHALAMSLTYSALSPTKPGYIYPATNADYDYMANKGKIPEGALLMLPPTFDLTSIKSPAIRKVAKTLMTYGAYVVDRNTGTPFVIYQEIGTKGIAYWQQSEDTRKIRAALRQATVNQFADANGKSFVPDLKKNLLSLRGNYQLQTGKVKSVFDSYEQKRKWGKTEQKSTEFIYVSRPITEWAKPVPGDTYVVTAKTEGGARFRFQMGGFDSGMMANGVSKTFKWPSTGSMVVVIESGVGESSSASGTVIKQ